MVSPKLSILNPTAISRVDNVRRQMDALRHDVILAGLPTLDDDPKAKQDRYFAAMPLLIKSFFNFLEQEITRSRPEVNWNASESFKVSFLKTYVHAITESSSQYFRELGKRASESLRRYEAGEIRELSIDERAYISFVLDDPNPNGGVTVLSPVDSVYIFSHIFGLLLDLGVQDPKKLGEILRSRGVSIFANSLMINEAGGMSSLMGLLSKGHADREHKTLTYTFDKDFFVISREKGLELRKDILSAVRRVYENNRGKLGEIERRNCPASYASKETNEFFELIILELLAQYEDFLRGTS